MTLVVAGIHETDRISIVSDTKITWDKDPSKTRRTYTNALVKTVILREDLAVGVAGNDPYGAIQRLVAVRERPVEDLLEDLRADEQSDFVVAMLRPARLWMVCDGKVEERTTERRAWQGEKDAYSLFQAKFDGSEGLEPALRFLSSMHALTSFDPVDEVGGYATRVLGTPETGFQFAPDFMFRGPHLQMESVKLVGHGRLKLDFVVPPGVDPTAALLFVFAGRGRTRGASGLLFPLAGSGRLFRHENPHEPVTVVASDPQEFRRCALEDHGQEVIWSGPGMP